MIKDFIVNKGEVDNAITILREVAKWCEATEKNMWKVDALTKDILMEGLSEDNFYVGKVGKNIVSSMILQWYDPLFWPEIKQNESGFIHKLCVKREYSGLGVSKLMIEHAIEECKSKGVYTLRLDTGWDREKLCYLYESIGFNKIGKRTIGETDYALYEMKVL
jgi:GNAT superfamily N-acetyltransferase